MDDFKLNIEVKVTVKPVNPKVGTLQRGPYERNLFVVRESQTANYTGLKTDVATLVANAMPVIARQWELGTEPPTINTVGPPSAIAATTATLDANVTDKGVSFASAAVALVVVATAGTITRPSGDFLADGFRPGQTIVTTNFTNAGNNSSWVIDTVTATVITVVDNTGLVDETGGGDEVCTVSTTGVFVEWGADKEANTTVQQAGESPLSGATATPVTADLTGLTASTQYYYRFAAVAKGLTVRTQLQTFTTPAT